MKDWHTQMSRGFGFVTFSDPSVIGKVLEEDHFIDGRKVRVEAAGPRKYLSSFKTRKIYVGGIPTSLTGDELKEHFSSYGRVVDHEIRPTSFRRPRRFAFVTFENEDIVEQLVSDGRMHELAGIQVDIEKALPRIDCGLGHGHGHRGHAYEYQSGYPTDGGEAAYGSGRGYGYAGSFPNYGVAEYGAYNAYGDLGGYSGFYGGYGSSYVSGGNAYGDLGGYGGFNGGYGSSYWLELRWQVSPLLPITIDLHMPCGRALKLVFFFLL